jgi:DNA-directed RNA polymerase specialized sigma24 family protein
MRATTQPGIEDLYREHALGLMRFALLLTGDRATAEDVVQDAFLGLYRARLPHRHHPPGRPAKVGSIVLIRRELHGPAS